MFCMQSNYVADNFDQMCKYPPNISPLPLGMFSFALFCFSKFDTKRWSREQTQARAKFLTPIYRQRTQIFRSNGAPNLLGTLTFQLHFHTNFQCNFLSKMFQFLLLPNFQCIGGVPIFCFSIFRLVDRLF